MTNKKSLPKTIKDSFKKLSYSSIYLALNDYLYKKHHIYDDMKDNPEDWRVSEPYFRQILCQAVINYDLMSFYEKSLLIEAVSHKSAYNILLNFFSQKNYFLIDFYSYIVSNARYKFLLF